LVRADYPPKRRAAQLQSPPQNSPGAHDFCSQIPRGGCDDSLGYQDDFPLAASNNIALIERGVLLFSDKVAGAVAFAAMNFPDETMTQRIARIMQNVTPLPGLAGNVVSGGRLNLVRTNISATPPLNTETNLSTADAAARFYRLEVEP